MLDYSDIRKFGIHGDDLNCSTMSSFSCQSGQVSAVTPIGGLSESQMLPHPQSRCRLVQWVLGSQSFSYLSRPGPPYWRRVECRGPSSLESLDVDC